MGLESRGAALGLLVALAATGSFLVPSEWFLWLNPARSEIEELRERQSKLKFQLTDIQKKRRETEHVVLLTKSELDNHRNALMRLAQRLVSTGELVDPFDGVPSVGILINEIKQEGEKPPVSAQMAVMADFSGTSDLLMKLIDKARNGLADYANQSNSIKDALTGYDEAEESLNQHQFEFNQLEVQIAGIEEENRVVTARLHDITRQSANQYLAMRAVALGALGAFAAALAVFLYGATAETRLQRVHTMLSIVFGGIVALVVFALFTTRELSVFANVGAPPDEMPDYWRVVILCLISGAFADRLFAAARERIDQATRGQGEANVPTPPGQGEAGGVQRP